MMSFFPRVLSRILRPVLPLVLVVAFTACETTSGPALSVSLNVPPEKPPLDKADPSIPAPEVAFGGEPQRRNYTEHFDIPLSTVSPEKKGPLDAPFDFPLTRQERAQPGEPIHQLFPLNNRTGNLLFYRDVGIPRLNIEKLDENHIRIWARVLNRTPRDIRVHVTCMGREASSVDDRYDYEAIILSENVYRDFSFVMTGDESRRFTLAITGID